VNRVAKLNLAALGLIVLIAGGLGGCGRAGPLEPPPSAAAAAKPAEDAEANANGAVPQARPRPKPIQPPNQPFVLDPLL
jgi:predicted small lipoprotein YifL